MTYLFLDTDSFYTLFPLSTSNECIKLHPHNLVSFKTAVKYYENFTHLANILNKIIKFASRALRAAEYFTAAE